MMLGLLILGVIMLIVVYTVPNIPPPLSLLLRVAGIICVAVAVIVIVAGALGLAVASGGKGLRWGY
jgi:hypothetical protein